MTPFELREWHFDSQGSIAGYVYGGGKDEMWIERSISACVMKLTNALVGVHAGRP